TDDEAQRVERDGMEVAIQEFHQRKVESPDQHRRQQQEVHDVGFALCHIATLTCRSRHERTMQTHQFGNTGKEIPVIGQGTWQMKRTAVDALRAGIELGMTHIDTAEMYTGAEEIVADAIRGRRQQIFLVSKVVPSNASYKGTLRACEASL